MQETQETQFQSLRVGKIPWRRKWQPAPVFLSGKISGTEEPGGLQSMGWQTVRYYWATECKEHPRTPFSLRPLHWSQSTQHTRQSWSATSGGESGIARFGVGSRLPLVPLQTQLWAGFCSTVEGNWVTQFWGSLRTSRENFLPSPFSPNFGSCHVGMWSIEL